MINIDIASIHAFVLVAEHGSFSVAAHELRITQPAVSKRIATMEATLAEKLFDRIGRNVILTEAGNTILPKCQTLLATLQDAQLSLENLSGQVSGILRLGTSHHIGLHHLPPFIQQFTDKYPNVELDLHFMDSEAVCDNILKGNLELGIVTLPTKIPANINQKVLWVDQLKFVVKPQHPLADLKNPSLADLQKNNAILPNRNTFTRDIIEEEFQKSGIKPQTKLSTNYLETIKMMVSVGLGWSVLPHTMIDNSLHIIEIPFMDIKRDLGTVQHAHRTLSNAAIAMLSILADGQ